MDLWVYELRPVDRGLWGRDLSDQEERAFEAHVAYLGQLLAAGRLMLGGSTRDVVTGMIFFTALSKDDRAHLPRPPAPLLRRLHPRRRGLRLPR
jgi:hypothetical protein